jgi:hypothetical protein
MYQIIISNNSVALVRERTIPAERPPLETCSNKEEFEFKSETLKARAKLGGLGVDRMTIKRILSKLNIGM